MITTNGLKKKKAIKYSWENKRLLPERLLIYYYLVPKRIIYQVSGSHTLNAFMVKQVS